MNFACKTFAQIDYLRASASLPYFSRIVELEGKKFLDGDATDSIPVDAFMKLGYEKNVLILTRDIEYRKSPELSFLPKLVYRVFVFRPNEPLNIGRMEKNPANVQRVYDIGYADAVKQLNNLKDWLSV